MVITLPERCDRAAAISLLPEFIAATGDQPIAVDASAVSQIGQAMVQLLLSARKTAGGASITASPALRETAALMGLDHELFAEHAQ